MISNSDIADLFKLMGNLLELHGENEFKARGYFGASFRIDKLPNSLWAMTSDERQQVEGLGKSILAKVEELVATNTIKELENLLAKTPDGILEMMKIKGIGPKKIRTIWTKLQIETVGELLYACKENRLVSLSGFGAKTQDAVIKSIEFLQSNKGKLHLDEAEREMQNILALLLQNGIRAEAVGQLARSCEVMDLLEVLVLGEESPIFDKTLADCFAVGGFELVSVGEAQIHFSKSGSGLVMVAYLATERNWEELNFALSAGEEFKNALGFELGNAFLTTSTYFSAKGLPTIIPEMWENAETLEWAKSIADPEIIIKATDLKGCIHNHSQWSDGANTVEEMALACIARGLEYFVISDHSKSAAYAGGLQPERVLLQQQEVDKLNQKLSSKLGPNKFKVFKSIESDILGDGSLDYDETLLKTFDLVIASVHSNLKMDEAKANQRLLKAIENPYTRILGHPTGRLLLSRPGYPINHKLIIEACAANGVVIELNSHPYRLDLDWRWIHFAQQKGVLISINPDAHEIVGIDDMHYGVKVARKAGLLASGVLNTKSLPAFETWLKSK